jgi:hypothetical protein
MISTFDANNNNNNNLRLFKYVHIKKLNNNKVRRKDPSHNTP